MPIPTRCSCGAQFKAPDSAAGKRVKCPKCAEPVTIPAAKSAGQSATIPVTCQCGKSLSVPAKYQGKQIACPACKAKLTVGAAAKAKSTAAASSGRAGTDDLGDMGSLLDEVDLSSSQTGNRCPNCRADLDDEDVICVKCGFDLDKGKQLKTKTVQKTSPFGGGQKKKGAAPVNAPKAVETLAKMLNTIGSLAVLAGVVFVVYRCYSAVSGGAELDINTVIDVMTGSAGYVMGGVIVLFAVPCSIAASQTLAGKPVGRVLSIVVAIVGLLGLITTLPAILALKLAFSDEVVSHCDKG